MNLGDFLNEIKIRGEKIKKEVLSEIVKSKTLNQIVSNENFIRAVSSIIATKDEVQKTLRKQMSSLIKTMEFVTHQDLSKMIQQLKNLEKSLSQFLYGKPAATPRKKTAAKSPAKGKKRAVKKPSRKK